MDDRALLEQAFLEARSTEKEPSEQDLESFAISEKTTAKFIASSIGKAAGNACCIQFLPLRIDAVLLVVACSSSQGT